MVEWHKKRVLVTGGAGFLGTHVTELLRQKGCPEVFAARKKDYDLTKQKDVLRLYEDTRPDLVIHLAGRVGGILANQREPAQFFYENLVMGTFVFDAAYRSKVEKFIGAVAGCGYPESAPLPLKEEFFWQGFPQKESAPYSLAKRMLHVQSQAYFNQYGFLSIMVIPGNLYGPYDHFDLERSHVVPALVRKFVDATEEGLDKVTIWGSGTPTRDFVYATDVAEAILLALEKYDRPELVNLSSGKETGIRELAELLKDVSGFSGKIVFDSSRPDGQARRLFDVSKARRELGFEAPTTLHDGLRRTVEWYRKNRSSLGLESCEQVGKSKAKVKSFPQGNINR
jgi:GDP-L-fucose synthase